VVAGKAKDLKEGVTLGVQSLDTGAAAEKLKRLVAASNA
jgi:anthranilate phosphoribosyltransferase